MVKILVMTFRDSILRAPKLHRSRPDMLRLMIIEEVFRNDGLWFTLISIGDSTGAQSGCLGNCVDQQPNLLPNSGAPQDHFLVVALDCTLPARTASSPSGTLHTFMSGLARSYKVQTSSRMLPMATALGRTTTSSIRLTLATIGFRVRGRNAVKRISDPRFRVSRNTKCPSRSQH